MCATVSVCSGPPSAMAKEHRMARSTEIRCAKEKHEDKAKCLKCVRHGHKVSCFTVKHRESPAALSPRTPAPTPPILPTPSTDPTSACPPLPLPKLPTSTGRSAVVGGIWIGGGPAGQACLTELGPPLGGTITVRTETGEVVATSTVGEHEFFEIPVPPGRYVVGGERDAPSPISLACDAPVSQYETTPGAITVEAGQASDVYCWGDVP